MLNVAGSESLSYRVDKLTSEMNLTFRGDVGVLVVEKR
jgi:hypothetical protein